MSRRNGTFCPKVGETGVGELGITRDTTRRPSRLNKKSPSQIRQPTYSPFHILFLCNVYHHTHNFKRRTTQFYGKPGQCWASIGILPLPEHTILYRSALYTWNTYLRCQRMSCFVQGILCVQSGGSVCDTKVLLHASYRRNLARAELTADAAYWRRGSGTIDN